MNALWIEQNNARIKQNLDEIRRKHNLAVDKLNEQQFVDVLRQMIASGDFVRYVEIGKEGKESQKIVYIPFRKVCDLQMEISKLRNLVFNDKTT